jgi:hypothetical protein
MRLRRVVLERLQNDPSLLPSDLAHKVAERALAATRKHPGVDSAHHETLDGQIEYFDLRDIQDTITAKPLWSRFEPIFKTKEVLNSRFGQLAELRNAIRHTRTLNEATIKDGEAALAWFGPTLEAVDRAVEKSGSGAASTVELEPTTGSDAGFAERQGDVGFVPIPASASKAAVDALRFPVPEPAQVEGGAQPAEPQEPER